MTDHDKLIISVGGSLAYGTSLLTCKKENPGMDDNDCPRTPSIAQPFIRQIDKKAEARERLTMDGGRHYYINSIDHI